MAHPSKPRNKLVFLRLQAAWLLGSSTILSIMAFHIPFTRERFPDWVARTILVITLIGFILFAWSNSRIPGFRIMIVGLSLNLVVILANGGLMPITPDTIQKLIPGMPLNQQQIGTRLSFTKGIILEQSDTTLWCLSDHFVTPAGLPFRSTFSPGDVLIVTGCLSTICSAAIKLIKTWKAQS